ncbi:hypothetical protein M407DRAFT_179787 [Tulasnella calospora MUT 4182]|uniref:tRNA-dihydrouridine(16/17) synthase [NAD(P)(+)] n=1 Tax=Tulasnella calospora MUT 4182 TaxID=1051891 RepID=A0A0C3M4N5_9AGAM|nr:hypothetical protein M407DRAFT_179787 [Tulasnella calospora MUT 4182]
MTTLGSLPANQGKRKLTGWELYKDVLKSPTKIVGPMVDQSELAWRILSRRYGAQLVYTPMISARVFADPGQKIFREDAFNILLGEEGGPEDRPLFIQFAANDPNALLTSAKMVEPYADAIDINFGCPQDIARRGRYGAYLCEDWDLIYKLINTLHVNLSIPVTAKFRIFSDVEKTVRYAQMMERAGAQILTCHGRTREQRGHKAGLADWDQIAAVKKAVSVPVFANGNVLYAEDVERCLSVTGADAYMSAEPQLHNPGIFYTPQSDSKSSPPDEERDRSTHLPHASVALEYLSIIRSIKTPTASSAIKAHLFRLFYPAFLRPENHDLRNRLGAISWQRDGLEGYEDICKEMDKRMKKAMEEGQEEVFPVDDETGLKRVPYWLCQPKVRPPPVSPSSKNEIPKQPTKSSTSLIAPATGSMGDTLESKTIVIATSPEGTLGTVVPVAVDDELECQADVIVQGATSDPPARAGDKRAMDATRTPTEGVTNDAAVEQGDTKRPKLQSTQPE